MIFRSTEATGVVFLKRVYFLLATSILPVKAFQFLPRKIFPQFLSQIRFKMKKSPPQNRIKLESLSLGAYMH